MSSPQAVSGETTEACGEDIEGGTTHRIALLEVGAEIDIVGAAASSVTLTPRTGPCGLDLIELWVDAADGRNDDTTFAVELAYPSGLRECRSYRIVAATPTRPNGSEEPSLQTHAPTTRIMRTAVNDTNVDAREAPERH